MPSRARARADRTSARNRRRLGIGAAVVAAGMVVGAATAFVRRDESTATNASASASSAPTGVKSATAQKPEHRALTVEDPLRLWIGGDSLVGSLGPSLGETTAASGVVAPRFDSRVSSGLSSPEFFDWPEHAAEEMTARDPEAVVFTIGTNDATAMPDLATADNATDVTAEYAAKVEEMMQIFIGAEKRPVYWVATPPMKDPDLDDNIEVLNGVIADVAAEHPEVTFIDVSAEFSDSDGDYTASVTDETGDRVMLRAGDGIHLTPEGGDRMAVPVFAAIDAAWRIIAQAVPGNTQPILETEGSSQIAGTSRNVSGSSGRSGSSGSGGSGTTTTTSTPIEEPPPETTPTTEVTTPPATDPPPVDATTPPASTGSTP
ncbi:MAG: DUF459 domain-containing protein [Acidimicrobiia bacterium]